MSKKSWPYPVLEPTGEDYPNCAFQASVEMKQTRDSFIGSVKMDLGSETLHNALVEKRATYMLQVHCPRTSYRSAAPSLDDTFQFELPEGMLRDAFTVQPFLVATGKWELSSTEFADIFRGMSFPVDAGYILAVAPQINFFAEKRLDDLKNVRAIFSVDPNPDPAAKEAQFDFDQERIVIYLPKEDHANYRIFRDRAPYGQMFVCALVLPALQQALAILQTTDSNERFDKRWQRVIARCLADIGEQEYASERTFAVAQKLLKLPLARAFAAVNAVESAPVEE